MVKISSCPARNFSNERPTYWKHGIACALATGYVALIKLILNVMTSKRPEYNSTSPTIFNKSTSLIIHTVTILPVSSNSSTDKILPVSFSSSTQVINETIHDALSTQERFALIYQHRRVSGDAERINNRNDDFLLARLRSGHHPSLRQYLIWLDPSQDPICPNYRLEVQDLLHRLCECPAIMTIRQRVFGNHQGSLEWVATQSGDVVAFAWKTLVNLDG